MLAAAFSNTDSNIETVKLLIDSNANLNTQKNDGWTALMLAAENPNEYRNNETIKLLIESRANVDMCNIFGNTALAMYICNSTNDNINKELLEILIIKSRLSLSIKNNNGVTVYDYYKHMQHNILDEYFEELLSGKISLSNTKSAKNT